MASDKKRAEEKGATLVFADESGFSQTPCVLRTWSKKGVTPVLDHWFARDRLNIEGSIACKPDVSDLELLLYMQPKKINSEIIIDYLDALHKEIPGHIVLLWDGYSSHKSRVVKEHIEKQKDWLTVYQLPAYAPELNPVEYLFSALKSKDVRGFCADHIAEIADKLELAVDRIYNNEQIIKGFLKASGLFSFEDEHSMHDT